jgi:hypothetical protein
MQSPLAPVSWGELIDKITILQIKSENLTSEEAISNVKREHTQLSSICAENLPVDTEVQQLEESLLKINRQLWQIEDQIRDKERQKVFDDEFIQLARNVYITNDERSRIKRRINDMFGSALVEEKSYSQY